MKPMNIRPDHPACPALLLALAASFGAHATPAATPADVADLDISELVRIRLSPFDVSSALDHGYRPRNSVSASRLDMPIHELPVAIQAFTEAFVEDQHPRMLYDVARFAPGVTYRSNDFNEGNANLSIRGFAVAQVPGAQQVLRDGVGGPPIFDMSNVARVEVVKGPSSFLYGQAAPGGIVNVITKTPGETFAGQATLNAGSWNQRRASADLTGPLSGQLFFRVNAAYDHDIEYWQPYRADARSVAPSLRWQPAAGVAFTLSHEAYRKTESPQVMQKPGYNRQAGVVPTEQDPNLAGTDVPGLPDDWNSMSNVDWRRSRNHVTHLRADFALGQDWQLRAGWSQLHNQIDMLFSGNLAMVNNTTFLQGRRFKRQVYTDDTDTVSLDAAGRWSLGEQSLRVLLGAQRVRRQFDRQAAQAPNDPLLGSNPTASPLPLWDLRDPSTWNREVDIPLSALTASPTDASSRSTDTALYAGATLGLDHDHLLLVAGVRQTRARSEAIDHIAGTSTPFSDAKLTPRLGLLYKLLPGWSAYASYAESFVPVQQVLRSQTGSTSAAQPTEGHGTELGLKAQAFDGRLAATLAVFDIHNRHIITDLPTTDANGNTTIYQLQSGEQRSQGVEFDAVLTPQTGWQLLLSASRMNARIVEVTGHDAAVLAGDPATLTGDAAAAYKIVHLLHGAPLQMSAPWIVSAWTRAELGGGWHVAGGVQHVRRQTLLPESPSWSRQTYTLLDATLGRAWTIGAQRLELELAGRNLLGEQYRPSQSTRARPREVVLAARFSW